VLNEIESHTLRIDHNFNTFDLVVLDVCVMRFNLAVDKRMNDNPAGIWLEYVLQEIPFLSEFVCHEGRVESL